MTSRLGQLRINVRCSDRFGSQKFRSNSIAEDLGWKNRVMRRGTLRNRGNTLKTPAWISEPYRPFRNSCPRAFFSQEKRKNRINAKIAVAVCTDHTAYASNLSISISNPCSIPLPSITVSDHSEDMNLSKFHTLGEEGRGWGVRFRGYRGASIERSSHGGHLGYNDTVM